VGEGLDRIEEQFEVEQESHEIARSDLVACEQAGTDRQDRDGTEVVEQAQEREVERGDLLRMEARFHEGLIEAIELVAPPRLLAERLRFADTTNTFVEPEVHL